MTPPTKTHGLRVLGLSENLQEVVVREEVEPREKLPLRLQVHVQRALDGLQSAIHAVQGLQEVIGVRPSLGIGVTVKLGHNVLHAQP